jgi:DNA-binding SARP family transcriptional activator
MATQTAVLDDMRRSARSIREPAPTSPVLTRVEATLLGGFEVRVDGRAIAADHWSRRHSAALIKLLALAPGRSLHREQVIDALWPDLDVGVAAPRLHKAAHYARKALGHRDAVVLSADTVSLCPHDDVSVDAVQFQRLAEAAVDTGGIAAAKGALAVYGGELLPHDPYAPWADQHRLQLSRLYTELLHQAEDWHQAVAVDPVDERAHLALAQRYAEIGDRGAALRQLDRLDQVMRHELGLEPSEQSIALRRQVLATTPRTRSREVTPVSHEAPTEATSPGRPCCPNMSPDR